MQRLTVLLALALAGNVAAEFGQKEGLAEALNEAPAPSVDEENARLRAEVASLRGRLHLPSIADGQTPPPKKARDSTAAPVTVADAGTNSADVGHTQEFVTFIVPTVGRPTLWRTLKYLRRQTDPSWRAIVVYDGNEEGAAPIRAKAGHANIDVIATGGKLGTTGHDNRRLVHSTAGSVRNIALSLVQTAWAAFVDDDDTVAYNYVAALRDDVQRHPRVKAVIVRLLDRAQNLLPPDWLETFALGKVSINFAVDVAFMRDHSLKFVSSTQEDYDLLHKINQVADQMLLSSHVTYFMMMRPKKYRGGQVPEFIITRGQTCQYDCHK